MTFVAKRLIEKLTKVLGGYYVGKIAFVFPGQGAQVVGMGKDIYEHDAEARLIFEQADAALGFSLSNLIFEGPDSDLKQTVNTQPALLTVSAAFLKLVEKAGMKADYVAGHSLGEYSALVAAGAISFEDAVRTVRARGQYMEQAVPSGQGAMAAVLGAERAALQQLCATITAEGYAVELANVNCPGQIVVSGSVAGVNEVVARGKEIGAKRVIPLEVSGPFHSSLMGNAATMLATELATVSMQDATIPVIANVTAEPVVDATEIKSLLERQVCAPVLWEDTILKLIDLGVDTFVEIGSGSVLTGLIKKIDRNVQIITINKLEALESLTVSQ